MGIINDVWEKITLGSKTSVEYLSGQRDPLRNDNEPDDNLNPVTEGTDAGGANKAKEIGLATQGIGTTASTEANSGSADSDSCKDAVAERNAEFGGGSVEDEILSEGIEGTEEDPGLCDQPSSGTDGEAGEDCVDPSTVATTTEGGENFVGIDESDAPSGSGNPSQTAQTGQRAANAAAAAAIRPNVLDAQAKKNLQGIFKGKDFEPVRALAERGGIGYAGVEKYFGGNLSLMKDVLNRADSKFFSSNKFRNSADFSRKCGAVKDVLGNNAGTNFTCSDYRNSPAWAQALYQVTLQDFRIIGISKEVSSLTQRNAERAIQSSSARRIDMVKKDGPTNPLGGANSSQARSFLRR